MIHSLRLPPRPRPFAVRRPRPRLDDSQLAHRAAMALQRRLVRKGGVLPWAR